MKVTPSKPDYWSGTPGTGRWTREQEQTIKRRGGFTGNVYGVTLRSESYNHETRMTDVVRQTFVCPLLATTATGRLVIAPNGMETWIDRVGANK